MKLAHDLALVLLPSFRSKVSRQDFTLAQLFACLVLREHMKLTYRRTVAVLKDNAWWVEGDPDLRWGQGRLRGVLFGCARGVDGVLGNTGNSVFLIIVFGQG